MIKLSTAVQQEEAEKYLSGVQLFLCEGWLNLWRGLSYQNEPPHLGAIQRVYVTTRRHLVSFIDFPVFSKNLENGLLNRYYRSHLNADRQTYFIVLQKIL